LGRVDQDERPIHKKNQRFKVRPAIIIFAKSPVPGKVKTRLAETIGSGKAASLYLAMVRDAARAARETGAALRWWVEGEAGDLKELTGVDPVRRQCGGDLGARLSEAFREAFSEGFGPVAAIGTDCPYLESAHLSNLLENASSFDASFIPSPDGGYSAVALKAPLVAVFQDIPWSSPDTLSVSLERISEAGKTYRLQDPLEDIDDFESLRRFSASLNEKKLHSATETEKMLLSPEFTFFTAKTAAKTKIRG
jgi:rSAM/selenodomain-associated transferase 1